ncbi:PAS domain S-box protein [bacterium]|nr:MAG: PAS domain S-box protein [bacterium]
MDFFQKLFSSSDFIPRAQCGNWTVGLIRLHNLSDFFIWTAYLAIPLVLVIFAYDRRRDLPFRQLFWLFGLFIFACGTTHLMDIILFYNPMYRLSGLIKLVTAAASWGTVIALCYVTPQLLKMRSPSDFEQEIAQRREVEASLHNEIAQRLEIEAALKEAIEKHQQTEQVLQLEVAQRQRMEAEWARIFDLSPDKLCVVGFDGFFKRVNPMWVISLGYTHTELMSRPVYDFVYPDDLDRTLKELEKARGGGNTESFENRFICKDGSYKWLSWRTKVVPEEELIYGAARDTTERKTAELLLQSTLLQLERSNRELQDFASIASHDLQEPLRAIQAFSERLQTKHKESLNEEGSDYLSRINKAASRMRSLIQDLLAYSRVTTRMQPFASVNLNTTIKNVMNDLIVRVEETGGRVEVEELPTIEADAMQMNQLFQNLIGNALKFYRDGVPPVIKVHALEPLDKEGEVWIQIMVKDNGIGFDQKFADRIFSPFERLHNKSQYSGTGIGLAICRKIAERHGGQISVQSVPGEGSQFLIFLPVRQLQNSL